MEPARAEPHEAHSFNWDARRLKRSAVLLAIIGMLGLLLLGEADPSVKVLGIVWTAAFAYFAFAVLRRGHDHAPVVMVTAEGVFDKRISNAVLPWSAISSVEGFDTEHVPFVGLDFHDAKSALASAKPLHRWFAPLHRLLRFPAVSINTSLLDGNDADLLEAILRFRPSPPDSTR